MAEWKSIVDKYVSFRGNDHWCCNLCEQEKTGHRSRVIAHLTRIPRKGVEICKKITDEQVEELKRELGLGPDSTDADGQQLHQPVENDDIRREKGNKKRKGTLGSGASGSDPREDEMSPLGALNSSGALGESNSVSDGNMWSLPNLENSVGAIGLRLDTLEHNPPFSVSNLSIFPPETWDATMMALPEASHDREGACVPNTGNGGFQGTNCRNAFGVGVGSGFLGALPFRDLKEATVNFHRQIYAIREIRKELTEEQIWGVEELVGKRNNDTNLWVGYAARFKSDVDDFNVAARNVRSHEEILQLLLRADELKKIGEIVIATGLSLLHPVPKDILSWNPTYMSCGSQLANHTPRGQFTPLV